MHKFEIPQVLELIPYSMVVLQILMGAGVKIKNLQLRKVQVFCNLTYFIVI